MQPGDSWQAITLAEREGKLTKYQLPLENPHRIHITPDLHYPFQNNDVIAYIIDLAKGCDTIIQIGDGLEAYGVSSHKKNPAIRHTLNDEAKQYRTQFWRPLREQNPKARLIQIIGNHEERIERYTWQKAPELYDIPGVSIGRLIHAERYQIEVHPRSGLLIAGYRIKHGDTARTIGSARSEMLAHRSNGISAHTHRCEHETLIDAEGYRTDWYSIGHACRPELLDYLKGRKQPNWQLSAGVTLTLYPDGTTHVQEHRLA